MYMHEFHVRNYGKIVLPTDSEICLSEVEPLKVPVHVSLLRTEPNHNIVISFSQRLNHPLHTK